MAVEEIKTEQAAPALVFQQPVLDARTYINRELSLIEYQKRLLDEAADERNPLLERIKLFAIVQANLDEFFMVRVSGIREQVQAGVIEKSPDGMTPAEEVAAIREALIRLIPVMHDLFENRLRPALAAAGIVIP
jgi:polyphosphate kinase